MCLGINSLGRLMGNWKAILVIDGVFLVVFQYYPVQSPPFLDSQSCGFFNLV